MLKLFHFCKNMEYSSHPYRVMLVASRCWINLSPRFRMPKNIEIKARIGDIEDFHKLVQEISKSTGEVINQEDTFFNIPTGRLKLRKLNEKEELIYYKRPDKCGPKLSDYIKVDRAPGELSGDFLHLLSQCLGIRGKVTKKRTLYMVGQTRVHVDEVDNLGHFMELEVVLNDSQSVEEGEEIAKNILEMLKIKEENLLDCAYVDMLMK